MKGSAKQILGEPKEIIYKIFVILLSNLLAAAAINLFYVPNGFLSGGVGGISILIWSVTKIPVGILMFLMNIPLALLGFKFLNRKFSIFAIISAFTFSFFVYITRTLNDVKFLEDILLCSLFGGLLNGVAMGFLFRNDLCQGGIDFLAKIAKERYNLNVGTALMLINVLIVSLGTLRFGIRRALYTIISMRMSYMILDRIQVGWDRRKQLIIVTEKSREIAQHILSEANRGVTYLHGAGGYSSTEREIIYCVVKNSEIVKIKTIIKDIDPAAFITISGAIEVQGEGFSQELVQETKEKKRRSPFE